MDSDKYVLGILVVIMTVMLAAGISESVFLIMSILR
jgi:hypothetical protein